MSKKNSNPKCIVPGCRHRAVRWDGGICGVVFDKKAGKYVPGYIVWLCRKHDPGHNHFDLPDSLPDAIAELVGLREELQKVWARDYNTAVKTRASEAELRTWRSLYLDKPEDRLWHDSDQTWWTRRDDSHYGPGGLFRAEPPAAIQKIIDENARLKKANARLRKRAKRA